MSTDLLNLMALGASLQDNLREIIAAFARTQQIDEPGKLTRYYSPTARQLRNIGRAATARGSFEEGWARAFVADKFGEATTHWRKLEDRVRRGVGNPCPLLLIGVPMTVVTMDNTTE